MKKILALFITCMLIINCQAAKKERLELNLTKGKTYTQKIKTTITINRAYQGKLITIGSVIESKMSFKVLQIQNSFYTLEVQYDSLSVKELLPNNIIEFNSWKSDVFSKTINSLLNKPFKVVITKAGKVFETNIDNLFTHMFDDFPELSLAKKLQIRSLMIKSFGEDAFNKSFDQISSFYPVHRVKEGSKWMSKSRIKILNQPIISKTTFILKRICKSCYYISGSSEITSGKGYMHEGDLTLPIKMNIDGKSRYVIKMDKKTGWIIDATILQHIKDTPSIKTNAKKSNWKTFPFTVNGEVRITE